MTYQEEFCLMMVSAMYENGGNTVHRFLDGHPSLYVYPFESQLGNSHCVDFLSSLYPFKYRYPEFPMGAARTAYYEMFFDEEYKTVTRNARVSKFRHADFKADERERKRIFIEILDEQPITRGSIVAAFFEASFRSWSNCHRSGQEAAYVGYSPMIGFDGDKILADFRRGHVIHVVRNPWSGFADTSKRPFPLSIERYAWTWAMMQHHALALSKRYSDRFHIVRFEDLIASPRDTMAALTKKLGLSWHNSLLEPSWNGKKLETINPWGTIRSPTVKANIESMNELQVEQQNIIREITRVMLPHFGYEGMPCGS